MINTSGFVSWMDRRIPPRNKNHQHLKVHNFAWKKSGRNLPETLENTTWPADLICLGMQMNIEKGMTWRVFMGVLYPVSFLSEENK